MNIKHIGLPLLLLAAAFAAPLHADIFIRDSRANVIYQYSNGVMYEGRAGNGKKIFKYDGKNGYILNLSGKQLAIWKVSENALYLPRTGRPLYVFADKGGHPVPKGRGRSFSSTAARSITATAPAAS